MENRCIATGGADEPLPLSMWIDELQSRDLCLTIHDIHALGPNEEIKILFIDNGIFDLTSGHENEGFFDPEQFFRSSYWCIFKKQEGLRGWAKWMCDTRFRPFEFQVELAPGAWHQLVNGQIPISYLESLGNEVSASEKGGTCPITSRVGWLGPSVSWACLGDMPYIYFG